MENDNILPFWLTIFFSLFWLQILNLPSSLQNKNTRVGPFPWKRSALQNPDRERANQSTGICLRLGLPYNKYIYTNRARGPYWGILARGRDSTDLAAPGPYENDQGPIFPCTARASSVSK